MNILILSCGTRVKLVQYFLQRENGFEKVVVTDCSNYAPALYVADKYYIVPKMTEPDYLKSLLERADKGCFAITGRRIIINCKRKKAI